MPAMLMRAGSWWWMTNPSRTKPKSRSAFARPTTSKSLPACKEPRRSSLKAATLCRMAPKCKSAKGAKKKTRARRKTKTRKERKRRRAEREKRKIRMRRKSRGKSQATRKAKRKRKFQSRQPNRERNIEPRAPRLATITRDRGAHRAALRRRIICRLAVAERALSANRFPAHRHHHGQRRGARAADARLSHAPD